MDPNGLPEEDVTRLRLTLSALCAAAAPFLAANDARAKIPDPRFSEVPAVLVGCPSGALLPSCPTRSEAPGGRALGFRVLLRDVNNAPLMNEVVTLDFSPTSIRLLGDDRAGTTVDCVARTISRFTDLQGIAEFAPRFCGHSGGNDVIVSGEGVWLRLVPARSTDIDADGMTGLSDFARLGRSFMLDEPDPATDLDPCAPGSEGRTTLADLALLAAELMRSVDATACP